ncbi:ATP-binding protein [Bradyrhizobium centrolobii]|uniref:ATP-binding protein n=1 Tax=Bradyrhizobium centrolobii TaxID=1505087 RepID=UPI0009EE7EE7
MDADATSINIEFEPDGIGSIAKIVVDDNGDGMPRAEAPQLFKNLGGSWKQLRFTTPRLNRMLHGCEGRGVTRLSRSAT